MASIGSLTILKPDTSQRLDRIAHSIKKICNSEEVVATVNGLEFAFNRKENNDESVANGQLIGTHSRIVQVKQDLIYQTTTINCERQPNGSWHCVAKTAEVSRLSCR